MGGGHSVPLGREEDSARALEEVVDWIIDIAEEKAQLSGFRDRTMKDAPPGNDESAAVFVYGTLKRDFYNYEKWIKPFLLRDSDGMSVERFVTMYCQPRPSHCKEDDVGGANLDDDRRNEGPIYDDAVATQRRMEDI